MVASRNQFHSLARELGSTSNGSMPAYAPMGEINARMNPQSFNKYRKVTALGEDTSNLGFIDFSDKRLTTGVAVSLALVYFGLDFPGARPAIEFTKEVIGEPYKYTQRAMLTVGTIGLAYAAFQQS